MLYHNIINSIKYRLVKQIIQEQRTQNHPNTFYEKVRTTANELNIKLEQVVIMKRSKWKRTAKDKVQNQTQETVEKEMENKTKLRTVREDKWERKEYITTCDSDLVKNIIKIRLHMWELKELSKSRKGHEIPHLQSKGRRNRKCTRVSNSRNSI